MAEPLIEASLLRKLEYLALKWDKSFAGLVGGQLTSRYAGIGQDFLDHRQFYPGDDLRRINWRAYLRFEKLFLKLFHSEPRVPVRLLVDCSASMATNNRSKFQYARRLAAALGYIALVRLQTVWLIPFSEDLGEAHVCAGGRHQFGRVVDVLTALRPHGLTNFARVARRLLDEAATKGLLIFISDFLSEDDCCGPLEHLAQAGHELLLIHLWDDAERFPNWRGLMELVDAETAQQYLIEIDENLCRAYALAFEEFQKGLERVARRTGGRYVGLSTSLPLERVIFGPLFELGAVG